MSVVEREAVVVEAPAVVPATTRDVLHRAADLLEEFGWCQHELGSKARGMFCMLGAVEEAEEELRFPTYMDAVCFGRDKNWDSMVSWNNHPGRTKAEVVAKLREAAEAAEAS